MLQAGTEQFTESERLFQYIANLKPHNTYETISLNEARRIILRMGKPLAKISQNIERNVYHADQKKKEIEKTKKEEEELEKNLEFSGISVKLVPLDYPRTVCAHENCVRYITETLNSNQKITKLNYIQQCHEHCFLQGIPVGKIGEVGLKGCLAFQKDPLSCSNCKHGYEVHQHIDYELEEMQKMFINSEVQEKLKSKKDQKKQVKKIHQISRQTG